MWAGGEPVAFWRHINERSTLLGSGVRPIHPFHWEIEFPEVYANATGGFDVIVGNPPFLGGTAISQRNGMPYFQFIASQFEGTRHHCDLVAYFFRRAFGLLKQNGCFGLVASNTIAQGDTREGGLLELVRRGATIVRATRRYPWPGEAAVVTSIVHVLKGPWTGIPRLDDESVDRISSFLIAGSVDEPPIRLVSNPYFSLGSKIYGQGFVFDDHDPKANSIALMRDLVADTVTRDRIRPYVGGEDLNDVPEPLARRFVIDLNDVMDEGGLNKFPTLRTVVEQKVKPERMKLGANPNNVPLKRQWWRYQAHRPALYGKLRHVKYALACSQVSKHLAFSRYPASMMFAHTAVVIPTDSNSVFGCVQSRIHEVWARFFASTLEDRLRYTPSDCLETFAFSANYSSDTLLEGGAAAYHDHRASLMISRNEGLTKTYNRFHDRAETARDIQYLRELHHEMDVVVLRAYGWNDLADHAAPEFLTEDTEPDHRYQGRLFWPAAFRDEVLARLLDLNARRAAEERAAGLAPTRAKSEDEMEDA